MADEIRVHINELEQCDQFNGNTYIPVDYVDSASHNATGKISFIDLAAQVVDNQKSDIETMVSKSFYTKGDVDGKLSDMTNAINIELKKKYDSLTVDFPQQWKRIPGVTDDRADKQIYTAAMSDSRYLVNNPGGTNYNQFTARFNEEIKPYLSKTEAGNTYLTKTDAAKTYATVDASPTKRLVLKNLSRNYQIIPSEGGYKVKCNLENSDLTKQSDYVACGSGITKVESKTSGNIEVTFNSSSSFITANVCLNSAGGAYASLYWPCIGNKNSAGAWSFQIWTNASSFKSDTLVIDFFT